MRRKFYTVVRNHTKTVTVVPDNTRMIALQTADGRPFFMIDAYPFFLEVVKLGQGSARAEPDRPGRHAEYQKDL
jgi:hypothetical protein